MKRGETMREGIIRVLQHGEVFTAGEMARKLGVRLSSIASLLLKMVNEGTIQRIPDYGPRGGYGYKR